MRTKQNGCVNGERWLTNTRYVRQDVTGHGNVTEMHCVMSWRYNVVVATVSAVVRNERCVVAVVSVGSVAKVTQRVPGARGGK